MRRDFFGWHTHRLPGAARVVRWGHYGAPLLLFRPRAAIAKRPNATA